MTKDAEKAGIRTALRIIRQRAIAERVARCIEAAAELHGCGWQDVVQDGRGHPQAARARVVAMHACVALGVPMLTTAKAFKRCRRSVHSAIRIGRPGQERRDDDVLAAMRRVVERVKDFPKP
jgi:hypothetical protein